jgi:hypothetical protein
MQLVKLGEDDLKRYRGYRNLALELIGAPCAFFEISTLGSTRGLGVRHLTTIYIL